MGRMHYELDRPTIFRRKRIEAHNFQNKGILCGNHMYVQLSFLKILLPIF